MFFHRRLSANKLLSVLLVLLIVVYPFAIYQFIADVSPRWFAVVLLCVYMLRFWLGRNAKHMNDWLMLAVVSVFCTSVIAIESQQLLKYYPVLMNLGMGLMFLVSLTGEQSLIERFASLAGQTPPPEAQHYLRNLNLLWGLLLMANGAVAFYTAHYSSLAVWALYNGFLSYLLIAGFAAGEWVFRGYYKKKILIDR